MILQHDLHHFPLGDGAISVPPGATLSNAPYNVAWAGWVGAVFFGWALYQRIPLNTLSFRLGDFWATYLLNILICYRLWDTLGMQCLYGYIVDILTWKLAQSLTTCMATTSETMACLTQRWPWINTFIPAIVGGLTMMNIHKISRHIMTYHISWNHSSISHMNWYKTGP